VKPQDPARLGHASLSPSHPSPAALRLQNFPAEALSFQLFDLAKKDVIRQGTFRGATALEIPPSSGEWFVLVNETRQTR